MGPLLVYFGFAWAVLAGVMRPRMAVYGYVAFVSLCPQWLWRYTLADPNFPFQRYIAASAVIGFLLSGMKGNRFSGAALYAAIGAVSYLLLSYLSAFSSIMPSQTEFFMGTVWKIILMLLLAVRLLDSPKKIQCVLWIVIICAGWNAWEINIDYLRRGWSMINLAGYGWARLNANEYSLVMLIVFGFGMAVSLGYDSNLLRVVGLVVAALCMHAIFIAESRGAMLGGLVTVGFLVVLMEKNSRNIGLVIGLIVITSLFAGPSVVKEFSSSFEEEKDVSAESRFYIWSAGVRMCIDRPLLGFGPWAAEYAMGDYYNYSKDRVSRKALHNLALEVATGSGIPAFIGYMAVFVAPWFSLFFQRAYRKRERADVALQVCSLAFLGALPGYFFAAMFNSGALNEVPYIMAAIGIATTCVVKAESSRVGSEQSVEMLSED